MPIPVGGGWLQGGGNDVLEGGTGDDILIGDANFIHAGRGGNDILLGGDGNDRLYGDAYTGFVTVGGVGPGPPAPPTFLVPGGHRRTGAGGDDFVDGGDGNDTIVGDAFDFQGPFQGFGSAAERRCRHAAGRQRRRHIAGDAMNMSGRPAGRRRPASSAAPATTRSPAMR